MSRLVLTFRKLMAILEQHGFEEVRHGATSHRNFKGVVGGQTRVVIVAYHRLSDEPARGTLQNIVRTSGPPKRVFREGK